MWMLAILCLSVLLFGWDPASRATRSAEGTMDPSDRAAPNQDSIVGSSAAPTPVLTLPVHAVVLSDNNGSRAAVITPQQVKQWLDRAGQVYAAAGIQFKFNPSVKGPDWSTMKSTLLNNLYGDSDPNWLQKRDAANDVADQHRGKIVLLFRQGPLDCPRDGCCGDCGFTSSDLGFIAMPGFDDANVCNHQNIDLLAHQIGHYLGLAHPQWDSFSSRANAETRFKTVASAICQGGNDPICDEYAKIIFDGDRAVSDPERRVQDTAPDPFIRTTSNQCQASATTVSLTGVGTSPTTFTLPRENVMSFYDPRGALSAQQIAVIRKAAQTRLQTKALPDLAITTGTRQFEDATPSDQFETTDIWVDSEMNGFNVYPLDQAVDISGIPLGPGDPVWLNHDNRIWFRIHNLGPVVGRNFEVEVSVAQKVAVRCAGGASTSAFEVIGKLEIASLAAFREVKGFVLWKPSSLSATQIKVRIIPVKDEISTANNQAIEPIRFAYEPEDPSLAVDPLAVPVVNPCDSPTDIVAIPLETPPNPSPTQAWKVQLNEPRFTLQPHQEQMVGVRAVPPAAARPGDVGETTIGFFQVVPTRTMGDSAASLELIGGIKVLSYVVNPSAVSCRVPEQQAKTGATLVISGELTPQRGEAQLALEYIAPSGRRILRMRRTDPTGTFRDNFVPDEPGQWLMQANWQGDAAYQPVQSSVCSFTATGTPPTSLYVSSFNTNEVKRYNAATGAFVSDFASGGGLGLPAGLTFGPDGDLYVSSPASNNVLRYDGATGALIGAFASGGGMNNPQGLVFGPDGNLYVSSFNTHHILRYDGTTGTPMGIFAMVPAEAGGNCGPSGLRYGPDGFLYASCFSSSSIARFDSVTGEFLGYLVSPGTGGLANPHGFAFGTDGNLYVSSFNTGQVKRYDGLTGGFLGNFVASPTAGGLVAPHGLAFGPDGNLYVSSYGTNQIKRYNAVTGAFISDFVTDRSLLRPTHLLFK
jgi:streptogramin lyase